MKSQTGIIKRFNNDDGEGGGYGFISRPGQPDVFVHRSELVGVGERKLFPGDKVSFDIGLDQQQRLRARNVRVQVRAAQPKPQHVFD